MSQGRHIVKVDWLDSMGTGGHWESTESITPMRPVKCRSVGWVLEETKKSITIAMTVSETMIYARKAIPKCSITKLTRLS